MLMRTVHSVINRTPPQFLEEVLLVDDFSDKGTETSPYGTVLKQRSIDYPKITNTRLYR